MEHGHHEKIVIESIEETGNYSKKNSEAGLIPGSIILGAVLISASIFYNVGLLIKNSDAGTSARTGTTGQQQAQGNTQSATAGQATGPVDVAVRSDAAVLGKQNAKVTIVEFTDFQCPFCQKFFNDAYKQVKEKYVDTGKAKIIFRHFPLGFHANAQKAGEAAECANRQGKFIGYHDVLFQKGQADGSGLDAESLKKYAVDLGLNTSKFNSCLDKGETAEVVKADMAAGTASGVNGTPTFFVNGQILVGAQPFSAFEQAIEAALK